MDSIKYYSMFGSRGVFYQTRAVISKNWLRSLRNRELISEIIMPIIAAVMISFKDNDSLSGIVSIFAPILIVVSANTTPRSLSIHLVEEKEGRYKETQKIMGLKQRAYVLGWIVYGYIKTMMSCLIFVLVWSICINLGSVEDYGLKKNYDSKGQEGPNGITPYKFITLYFIYASALLNQSLMFSTLFSTAKLAGEVITFLQVLTILFPYLVFIEKLQTPTYFILLSILPQCSMSFIFESTMSNGVFSLAADQIARNYSIDDALIQMSVESIIYLILYFYFDQIIPNEYGVSKSPFFFITDLLSSGNANYLQASKVSDVEVNLINKQHNSDHVAVKLGDYSSAIYHQKLQKYDNKQSTVRIRNLTKKFGEFTAVDHLGINLYQSEILCLLGHNGAGKTTTISLLTGLLSKTSGEIIINDLNLEDNLDYIRQCVGICNQRDVLYNELTVREQLVFMGRIKGLSGQDLDQEIAQIMKTNLLETESEKIIATLSGGNKRKLSLALALIGGSVVIFLDEPTSGMDAMSRRVIWEILETVKRENRTIVLTTHHLDEAEHLADRIAIMAAGKLLACGSSEYIKNNFGEGYQLSIMVYDANRQDIIDLTLKLIPHSILDPQSSQKSLLFLIPIKSKQYLLEYFRALETQFQNTIQVNFTINSLEDAFVNIGMDEEKFIQRARKQVKGSINNEQDQNDTDNLQQSILSEDGAFIEQQKVIKAPECLSRPPQFIMSQQLLAMYNRKYYTTVRSFSNYLAVIIPFALIITGILVCGSVDFGIIHGDDYQKYIDQPERKLRDIALDKYVRQYLVGTFMLLSFCFNSSIYIYLPLLERETNLKYALTAMGCRSVPYWVGTFLFDYTLYLMFVIVAVVLSYIFVLDFLTDYILEISATFLSFGFSYCFYSYFMGIILFKKASAAMKVFPFFNYFIAFTGVQLIYLVPSFFLWRKTQSDGKSIIIKILDLFCCLISPFYTFNKSFNNLTSQDQYVKDKVTIIPQISTNNYVCAGFMIIQGLIFFGLTLLFERLKYDNIQSTTQSEPIEYAKENINDPAVLKEEELMIARDGECPIRVTKLQKRYENGFLAVKNSSFGVHPQEIIGLLGPNGAGKSTSFNILTSLIGKTTGSVQILGTEINRSQVEIFKETGICPQFDCIWENLTPVEHLYLFGRMKGLSGNDLEESVNYFIQTMQLDEYVKRKAGRLSGGNKRKLCVSNALIGGPSIQFFDEPSTGVDPIARRFLWQTLKQGVRLRQSSVVITTHTMDEAESLCDRIAIMINGEIYCLGSPQDLKNKYGQGYTIQIKGHTIDKEQLLKLMQSSFPTCKYIDEEDEHEYLTVYVATQEYNFYRAFELLESQLVAKKMIKDFCINQASLESVFLQFSRLQGKV